MTSTSLPPAVFITPWRHAMTLPARLIAPLVLALSAAPAMAQWSTATLSVPRTSPAGASVGEKALFAGGFSAGVASDVVDIYDTSSGSWTTATLSSARGGISATTVGHKVYFAGGYVNPDRTGAVDTIDVYDDSTGAWSTLALPSLSQNLWGYPIVALTAGHMALFSRDSDIDILDTQTGIWTTETMPFGNFHFPMTGATLGAKAAFVSEDAVMRIYDADAGTWTLVGSGLGGNSGPNGRPLPGRGPASAFAGGDLICGGGERGCLWFGGSSSTQSAFLFDIGGNGFTTGGFTQGKSYLAATSTGNKALFAGGAGQQCGVTYWRASVDIYDSATGAWTVSSLSAPRGYLAAATVGSLSLFAGGENDQGPSDVVDIYDESIGATYCSPAVINSTGQSAAITAEGFPGSVAQGYVLLRASSLPPAALTLFLCSPTQGNATGPGGSQGTLCLGGAIGRFLGPAQIGPSSAAGIATLNVDLTQLPRPGGAVAAQAGETWNFQAWYRDVNPGPTSNFTDAVSVTLQ